MTTVYQLGSVLLCLLPFIVGIGLVNLAAAMARRKLAIGLAASSVIAVVSLPVLPVSTYFLMGGGFGPGAWVFFGSIPAAIIACALAIVIMRSVGPGWRRWYLLAAGVVIPLSLLAIPFGSFMPRDTCNEQDRIAGAPILAALESYQRDHGGYPRDLAQLVPQYLSAIPTGPCHSVTRFVSFVESGRPYPLPDFYLCEGHDRFMLRITEADGDSFYQGYDLTDKKWGAYDDWDLWCAPIK